MTKDSSAPSINLTELQEKSMQELTQMANELGIEGVGALTKQSLVFEILKSNAAKNGLMYGGGVMEVLEDGFGFLRSPRYSYLRCPEDIYLSPSQIRRFSLRNGDTVTGQIRPPREKERFFAMLKVEAINGEPPEFKKEKIPFEDLTPIYPTERLIMERDPDDVWMRVIDLMTPIGKGQRGLIVAPPRSGRSQLIQRMANAISQNNPDVILVVLLIGERPEEVTDMERGVDAEVIASLFDESPQRHVQIADMVLEQARRLAEHRQDVVVLIDNISELARAYNAVEPTGGRVLEGGLDMVAVHKARHAFSAGRNLEQGGSVTVLATLVDDPDSPMDVAIRREFRGIATLELVLDRALVDARIFPPINILESATMREETMLHPEELERVQGLRRKLLQKGPAEAMEELLERLRSTRSNAEFLLSLKS